MTYWTGRYTALMLFLVLAVVGVASAQSVDVQLQIRGCDEAPRLFQFNGFLFEEIQTARQAPEAEQYTLTIPRGEPRFYYIGRDAANVRPVILGSETNVVISGECGNIRGVAIAGSPLNDQYEGLKSRMDDIRQRFSQQLMAYRNAKSNEEINEVLADMRTLDKEKLTFLDSLKTARPFFARIAALNTYLSFFNNNNGRYGNEVEYFAGEYFKHADFGDPGYNYLPWVFEAFQGYTQTLSTVGLDDGTHRASLEKAISMLPAGSVARQLAYGGALSTLEQRNHPNILHFAKSFLGEYPEAAPATRQRIEALIVRTGAFVVGGQAPDFAQATPDGAPLRLSDLRGKVVLVDFWASWCGPCRRENPNVVRMYNKFKDKGFEILGVSLDKDRERWLAAIDTDGLTWQHVSDLKGWQNEVAQTYNVRSIPHTILLDKEGRIIARNLRGEALERKLEEIFN